MQSCMSLIPLSLVLIASLLPRSVLALDSTPVKNLVVFGDSYSDAGNFHRWTNGPIWSEDLAVAWNASLYSFAHTGSACDNALFPNVSMEMTTPSIRDQIEHFYHQDLQLDPTETLFAIWVGVNDIQQSYQQKLGSTTPPTFENVSQCITEQIRSIRKVFGANRIMVFNVPPMQHMPFFIDREDKPQWETAAEQLNRLIQNDVVNLNKHHHALELDLIDINSLLTDVMADPSMFNFVNALDAYLDVCHGTCTDNVDSYVWWDRTHITGGMHRLIANSILLAGSYGKSMSLDASVGDVTAWINAPGSPYRSPKYTPPPHTGVIERVMQQIAAESLAPIYVQQQDDFDTDLFANHRLLTVASLLLLLGIIVIVWIRQQHKRRGSSSHQLGILGSFATPQEQQHRRFRSFSPPFHSSGSSTNK